MTVVVPPNAADDGGAVEIVGAHHPGRGALLDMAMAVDAAGQHELAARIDLARPRAEALAERRDDAVLDADIAGRGVGRGRHRAVADHQIVFAHARPSMSIYNASSIRGRSSATVADREQRAKGIAMTHLIRTARPSP